MNASALNRAAGAPGPDGGSNRLLPVFLKLEQLRVLLVGGGAVALARLTDLLENAPEAAITVIGSPLLPAVHRLAARHPGVQLHERAYCLPDLLGHDLVLIATDDPGLNSRIRREASGQGLLSNVADAPEECDFYFGSVVRKGDLKIAISTNGKSAHVASGLGEVLDEVLPDELPQVLRRLATIRSRLHSDLAGRVKSLDAVTAELAGGPAYETPAAAKWRRLATAALVAFGLLLTANIVSLYYTWPQMWRIISNSETLLLFVAVGFAAQLVDGLLGMGYGVVTAISLMSMGLNPVAVSASIHTAEMFASGASGYQHYRFGNVNRRLVKALIIPGILGAVSGALLLSHFGERYAQWVKPLLAVYLLLLGLRIISRALSRHVQPRSRKVKRIGVLAGVGGFLDSFGGGGWGPLVTSTLLAKGRTPQYVIGSVSLTEFFVTFSSALTFFATIGISHWQIVLGLVIGGVAAAPLAARLAGRIHVRFMMLGVGFMVIAWSLWALRGLFI